MQREFAVQLIYYAHSYRQSEAEVNEFFQELMVDEEMTPSLDPPSDRLNSAKPERHLRSTDGMVIVLPQRDPGPSEYIRWEIGLGMRARRPLLVFIEDLLPDNLVPAGLLQRRFSRRRLLREARDHRHAIRTFKTYVGNDPPPSYQPVTAQRRCAVIGAAQIGQAPLLALTDFLAKRHYKAVVIAGRAQVPNEIAAEEFVQSAALCIAVVEDLTPAEYYLLGAARAALTPTIAITLDEQFPFDPVIPREYQPRYIRRNDIVMLLSTIDTEIATFEEDYLDLKEEQQVHRYAAYRERVLRTQRNEGEYSRREREQVVNYIENAEIDMSRDKVVVSNVVGPVNIKARLDHVTQTVQQANGWSDERRDDLNKLLAELQTVLKGVAEKRPADAERVVKSAELVVDEATKEKPDQSFLAITAEGLKQAAKAVADIAPTALEVAGKIAAFVVALG